MSCCGNHDNKKSSWLVWIIVLIVVGLLVFSLIR